MKKYLVDFATKEFKESQKLLEESALKFGIDQVISFTPKEIKSTDFYKKNKGILDQKRGAGYWLWKPYIILKVLEKINDGDILIYADSGIEIINNLEPLFKILQNGKSVLTFSCSGHLNRAWTKRDCFILMDCDTEKYWDSEQRLGSFHLYKKDGVSIAFVKDWMKYAEDEKILTDKKNTQGHENLDGFIDHRHDQSIFSLLAIKNGFESFRDPTQWGNYLKLPAFRTPGEFLHKDYAPQPYLNSPYGTLLNHHRRRGASPFETIKNKIMKISRYIKRKLILAQIHSYKAIDGWLTPREAVGLYTFARKVPAKGIIVEIGSWKGKSTYCLAKAAKPDVTIIAIDPFDYSGEPGSKEEYERRRNGKEPLTEFTENMKKRGVIGKIEIKKGLSRDFVAQTNEIDLLFIDGDHSIEGCRYDYENYSPKIKPGGYLLFHDYNPKRKSFGPTWVVEELVLPSKKFEKIGAHDSLCVFKKSHT